jgi:PKD repeat protein
VFPITAKGTSISRTEGQSFSGTVATFTVPSTTPTPANYSASIAWGDGATSAGTVTGGSGSFTVNGTHTYAEEGSYTAKVTITDVNTTTNKATANTTATIGDAALHASGVKPGLNGHKASGRVATFTDDNPNAPVSDFSASINWGDGTTTKGNVATSGSKFSVSGTHTYNKAGTFTIKISIKDDGGSTASATTTVTIAGSKPKPKPHHKKVVHGAARLSGVPAACVLMPFNPAVNGKRILSVTWSFDGHGLKGKTVKKGKKYSSRASVSPGSHHLTVKVKFVKASKTAPRTFHRTVSGCPVVSPKFTG